MANGLLGFWMQVDYLMSRLTSLEGRIGGTEDQLNLEMDHRCPSHLLHKGHKSWHTSQS